MSGNIRTENLRDTEIPDHDNKRSFGSLTKAKVTVQQWNSEQRDVSVQIGVGNLSKRSGYQWEEIKDYRM